MKRFISFSFFVLVALSLSAQGRCWGHILDEQDDYVNVRKGPSTSTPVVQKLYNGKHVYFTPTGSNWYKISLTANGQYLGYVYWNRVDTWSTYNNKTEATYSFTVTDPDGYTNVRQLATTKSQIVKKLNKGTHFQGKYAVDANGWIGVFDDMGKLIGFVHSSKVKQLGMVEP